METINLPDLLLHTRRLIIEDIQTEEYELCLTRESPAVPGTCPKCSQESSQLHSTDLRFPLDRPWAEGPVRLHRRAKRFFGRNRKCPKKTFAERFPDFLARSARRTDRVLQKQQGRGVNVCARPAEKRLKLDQVGISDTPVNRLLRHLPEPEQPMVRVLGVDDWAKRKGPRYGTILVDLERGQMVDRLGARTAEPLVKGLEDHPGIEIVSRDRSQTYGDASRRGASEAIQVADRWPLLKNASEVIFTPALVRLKPHGARELLPQEYAASRNLLNPEPTSIKTDDHQAKIEDPAEDFTVAEQRRKDRIDLVRELHGRGGSQKEIVRQIHRHPKTVCRYLRVPIPTRRSRRKKRLLDPSHPYLLKRWNEGCHHATRLWRAIQAQGFAGQFTMVLNLLQPFRKASGLPLRVQHLVGKPLASDPTWQPPSWRTLSDWVLKQPENRKEEHEKLIEPIRAAQPRRDPTLALAREFASRIRGRNAEELDPWLEKAEQSGYRIWNNFVTGRKQDQAAVRAARSDSWSHGPTEGHIHRLKCLKRRMYGRAKDELLRKRVLWQGKWAFT